MISAASLGCVSLSTVPTPIMELAHSGGGNGDLALGMFLVLLTDGIRHSPRHVTSFWIWGDSAGLGSAGSEQPLPVHRAGWAGEAESCCGFPASRDNKERMIRRVLQSRLHMATSSIDSVRRIQVCPCPPGLTVFLVTYRMVRKGSGPELTHTPALLWRPQNRPVTRGFKEIPRQPSGDLTCRRGHPARNSRAAQSMPVLAEVVRRAYKRWAMEVDRRDKKSRSHRGSIGPRWDDCGYDRFPRIRRKRTKPEKSRNANLAPGEAGALRHPVPRSPSGPKRLDRLLKAFRSQPWPFFSPG